VKFQIFFSIFVPWTIFTNQKEDTKLSPSFWMLNLEF
jgi:hypothetical protein